MDNKKFFDAIRNDLFIGKMNQTQVNGINLFIEALCTGHFPDTRKIAYVLATVYHETDKTMQPIEEYGKGKDKRYGNKDSTTGHVYYGRGYVQLTWRSNYQRADEELKFDLVNYPEHALVPSVALAITIKGMDEGWFTGKKLDDYFNEKTDFVNARKIINGLDKAALIAGYAEKFYKALNL